MSAGVLPQPTIEPMLEILETSCHGISEKKPGNRIQAVMDFEVVEKTKTYTVLRVKSVFLLNEARKY